MSRTPHCWYAIKVFPKEHIHRPRISALRIRSCYCLEEPSQLITNLHYSQRVYSPFYIEGDSESEPLIWFH